MIRHALATLAEARDLSPEEAARTMEEILSGEASAAQIAAFAMALRLKGETVAEVTALARVLRQHAEPLPLAPGLDPGDLLDTCGTGGDQGGTCNVSTAVALVAAGAGARVAKHGNRAVSGRCGSADVLEALGAPIDFTAGEAAACLEREGIAFLFAPLYHGALRHAAAPRRELGVRTVFNVLGPLGNPARAGRQLVGVYDERWVRPLAEVLRDLGSRAACVVHSRDGLDEISVFAPTHAVWLADGSLREQEIDPAALGLARRPEERRAVESAEESAAALTAVLAGEPGPDRDLVVANAAAALMVAGLAGDLREGVERARTAIDSGAARGRLAALVAFGARRHAVGESP